MKGARKRTVAACALIAATMLAPAHATPPLPQPVPTPVMSYDAFGFGVVWKGRIAAVSRQGTRHFKDPTGRIALYDFVDAQMQWPPSALRDTQYDDRGAAGGVTPTGALVYFYSRLNSDTGRWVDMWSQRISADGAVSNFHVPTGPDGSFSAYGPLVALPSGRLMQTVYGWGRIGERTEYRIRALFSKDDGRTWDSQRMIYSTNVAMPNETAAVAIGGPSDQTTRLIALTRSARWIGGKWVAYVLQSISTNGGRTWREVGWVGAGRLRGVSPWIADIGGGRLAMVTAVRDHQDMTIEVSIARTADVFSNPNAWPPSRTVYRSKLQTTPQLQVGGLGEGKNFADFGYPSIVQAGPADDQKFIIFCDSHTGNSGVKPYDLPADTDLMIIPLLFGQ